MKIAELSSEIAVEAASNCMWLQLTMAERRFTMQYEYEYSYPVICAEPSRRVEQQTLSLFACVSRSID